MYNCIYCKYATDIKCNYKTHLKSKRHHKNVNLAQSCSPNTHFCSSPNKSIETDSNNKKINENIYNCKHCTYSTNRLHNYKRHLNTCKFKTPSDGVDNSPKSISPNDVKNTNTQSCSLSAQFCSFASSVSKTSNNNKNNKIYYCNQCDYSTGRANNLNRHLKSCVIIEKEKIIAELKTTNTALSEENAKLKQELNELRMKHSIELLENENKLLKKHAKIITTNKTTNYIINNYTNAPNLVPPNQIEDFEKYSYKGIQKGFSELINDLYCKNVAPQERSFWCVDPSRHKYMLRHNNMWNIDMEGKIFCDIVKETISKMYLNYTTQLVENGESNNSDQILSLREFTIDLLLTKKIPNCAKKYLVCDQNKEYTK